MAASTATSIGFTMKGIDARPTSVGKAKLRSTPSVASGGGSGGACATPKEAAATTARMMEPGQRTLASTCHESVSRPTTCEGARQPRQVARENGALVSPVTNTTTRTAAVRRPLASFASIALDAVSQSTYRPGVCPKGESQTASLSVTRRGKKAPLPPAPPPPTPSPRAAAAAARA